MKKKLKKSLACLLATLLIFSTVPMSALADEAAAPVTVETVVEEAAPDTEPDAEPTATPEASAKPSAEPTAEPSPEATEEPTESEVSAEPEATAEPTASPTPNPEDEISLLALGDEAVTRYRTVGINGNFSSNYLYDLGQYPLYDILLNGTSYPAYCLQHGKGRVNNAQQRLEVMEMQRIRQEQRAAEYAEKQQQQQNLSFAARLLNTIGNALCRQTLRDQQSATATTDRKQRRMQRRLKRALGQKEDYEQIFQ